MSLDRSLGFHFNLDFIVAVKIFDTQMFLKRIKGKNHSMQDLENMD